MDEIWVRVGLVAAVTIIAVCVGLVLQRRGAHLATSVDAQGFDAGVYFFSSVTCDTCAEAREKLDAALGRDGYAEISWEDEPDPFGRLGVDTVPAVMIVDDQGGGRLYRGQPDQALAESAGKP